MYSDKNALVLIKKIIKVQYQKKLKSLINISVCQKNHYTYSLLNFVKCK